MEIVALIVMLAFLVIALGIELVVILMVIAFVCAVFAAAFAFFGWTVYSIVRDLLHNEQAESQQQIEARLDDVFDHPRA